MLEKSMRPDDVLNAIFQIAKKTQNLNRFRGHDYQLQRIFHGLAAQFKELGLFVYSTSGPRPYSPILNESVSRLQLSGLIGRDNPEYEFIFLKDPGREHYEKITEPALTPEQKTLLTSIAEKFAETVNAAG